MSFSPVPRQRGQDLELWISENFRRIQQSIVTPRAQTVTAPSSSAFAPSTSPAALNTYTKNSTGFVNPADVIVSYNPTNRTVTLTGDTQALWRGAIVLQLVPGWTSVPHDAADGQYFLQYTAENGFYWSSTPWTFDMLMIALAYRDGANFCLRECHGASMSWASHKEAHDTIKTYKSAGGDFSAYTLNSTTAANRRLDISVTTVNDEDLPSVLDALTSKTYTHLFLTGANETNIVTDQTDIVPLSGNVPFYNQFNGTTWGLTPMSANNSYQKIVVMAIPTTADAECKKARYCFVTGQTVSTSETDINNLTVSQYNIGHISPALAEFVFIGEIVIRYTTAAGGNWDIRRVAKLEGSRGQQLAVSGNFLSVVATDGTTTSGNGTTASPVIVAPSLITTINGKADAAHTHTAFGALTLSGDQTYSGSTQLIGDNFIFRKYVGGAAYQSFYGAAVTPNVYNPSITFERDGSYTALGASDRIAMSINNGSSGKDVAVFKTTGMELPLAINSTDALKIERTAQALLMSGH